jgi:UPF0755 protein
MLRLLSVLIALVVLAAAGAAYLAWRWVDQPLALAQPQVQVTIGQGTKPQKAAEQWVAAGVQTSPQLLWLWFRVSGDAAKIKSGEYELNQGATPRDLLAMMVRGAQAMLSVRITEGWTFKQMRQALAEAAPGLRPTTKDMTDAQLMEAIGAKGVAPEGRFFPDTYSFNKGAPDILVLKKAYQTLNSQLEQAWAARAGDSPLKSPDDLLKLASIVEKETGREDERGQVAAVFLNRLRIDMPLQTDPTVIYGMGDKFDGNLRKKDLQTDTPYNTYLRRGLPPTPISLPGANSLKASVKPDASKALYFVARGDGTSQFSETLAEHNRAVNKFQRGGN